MNRVSRFFESNPTTPMAQNIERWIKEDLNASLDDVDGFEVKLDMAKLSRDKDGNKPKDGYEVFVPLNTFKYIITLSNGTKHSIRCIDATGELINFLEEDEACQ